MKYDITNTVVNGSDITVFMRFDNGFEDSHTFPVTTPFNVILQWAADRASELEARALEAIRLGQELADSLAQVGD